MENSIANPQDCYPAIPCDLPKLSYQRDTGIPRLKIDSTVHHSQGKDSTNGKLLSQEKNATLPFISN